MRTIMMTLAAIAISTSANALTLKSGEVLTDSGVKHASETATGMAQIEEHGFYIAGGQVHLAGSISIDVSAIAGKSKDQVVALIGDAAAKAIEEAGGSLDDSVGAAAAAAEIADAAYTGAQNGHSWEQVIESANTGVGVKVDCSVAGC